jgi:hypothetical protein
VCVIFSGVFYLLIRVYITRAYEYDRHQEDKILQVEKSCILSNKRNTIAHRDHSNQLRRDGRIRKAQEHRTNLITFEEIEDELAAELEARKASQVYTKELREKKKLLQTSTGIKKRRNPMKAAKGKGAMPLEPVETDQPDPEDDAMETAGVSPNESEEVDAGLMGDNPTDLLVAYPNTNETLTDDPVNHPIADTTVSDSQTPPTLSVQGPLEGADVLTLVSGSGPLLGRSQRIRTVPKTFGEAATTEFSDVDTPKRPRKRCPRKQQKKQHKNQ